MTGAPDLYALYSQLREAFFRKHDGSYYIPAAGDVTIQWSTRMTAAAGKCYPAARIIRLSVPYHRKFPHEIPDTLLHEMIHLIVPGHGPAFQRWMERIRAMGGRVRRYATERATPAPAPRWIYLCTRCRQTIPRLRRLPGGGRGYRHKECGGSLREMPASAR